MRIAILGAGPLSISLANILIDAGHDVVVFERDDEKIDQLSDMDCGFIHGDGTKPAILREAGPDETDYLFCLTDNDRDNILASLVGRSLGFERVVPKIEDTEFEHVCLELGLTETIVPDRTIARTLAETVEGESAGAELGYIKGDARLFVFVADEEDTGKICDLDLAGHARVVCLYRQDKLVLPTDSESIEADDEVVLVVHVDALDKIEKQYSERRGIKGAQRTGLGGRRA